MALIVGNLMARLGLDDSGFTSGMSSARSSMQGVGQTANQMSSQVTQATARVRSAYSQQATAAQNLRQAQERLKALQQSGSATADQLAAAQRRLGTAQTQQARTAAAVRTSTDSLRAAQNQATQSTNQLTAAAGRARNALAAVGVTVGIAATIKAFTDAIGAARALGAQTNQMNVIFGEGKAKVEAWGESASTTMRMSQREAQGAAIQFATFGKAMGLAGDGLVQFSTEQTKLAADLASFQGIPVADAIQAMGSAYAGETETMRQYGVLLDENTIKTAAYENNVAAAGSELTVQQKAAGTYYAMLEQLSHVNGDVERSNGKFGASLKTLTARLEETQAVVGNKLVPVVQPFVDLLAGPGLSAIEGIAGVVGGAASAFNSLPGPIKAALAAIVAFRIGAHYMGSAVAGVFQATRKEAQALNQRAGMDLGKFGIAVGKLGNHIPIVARMQTSFVNAAISAERFPRAAGAMAGAMTGLKGAAGGLMGALGGPWGLAIAGATAALTMWIAKKQKDKQTSQEAEAATQKWADAFVESKGAIDGAIKTMASNELEDSGALKMARELGIATEDLTEAFISGQGPLDAWMQSQKQLDMFGKDDDTGQKILNFSSKMHDLSTKYNEGRDAATRMAKASGDVSFNFDKSKQAAGAMSGAIQEVKESTDGAASRVDKLSKALKGLTDDKFTIEESMQAWADGMRSLHTEISELGDAVILANGRIDVTANESSSKLQDLVRDQSDAYKDVASAVYEEQTRLGKSTDEVNRAMVSTLGPMREAFITQMTGITGSRVEAEKLANTYLGMPGEILTQFQLVGIPAALSSLDRIGVKGAEPIEGTYHMVDNTDALRKKLDEMGVKYAIIDGKIVINDNEIDRVKKHAGDLAKNITDLPDGYVKITDTTPKNLAHLREVGIKTQTLPDGTVVIKADDKAFLDAVARAQRPGTKTITIQYVDPVTGNSYNGGQQAPMVLRPEIRNRLQPQAPNADGSVRDYANGAVRGSIPSLPSEAVIEPGRGSGLVRWAEAAAGAWEAFIPGKKTARTISILSETARRLGFGIMPIRAYADGAVRTEGLTTDTQQAMWDSVSSRFPGATMNSGTRYADVGSGFDNHMGGTAIDIGGSAEEMMSIAQWIGLNYPDSKELIHGPGFAGQIKDGKIVGDGGGDFGFYAGAGNHADHVHWAMGRVISGDGGGGAPGTVAPITLSGSSSRDDVARKIIAEGRARGYSDAQIQAVLATAIQESNLDPAAQGGGGAWHGIFQQDSSYEGRDDPNTNITGFYDRLDEKRTADPNADIYDQIFWLQQRPGDKSAADAVAGGRGGYMDEIKGQDDAAAKMLADLGPGVGTGGMGDSPSSGGVGQNVYVTGGRLDSIGGGYSPSAGDTGTTTTGTTSGDSSGGQRKRLFTIGGGWPFYNPNPSQPEAPASPSSPGTTKQGTPPSASSLQSAQDAVEKAQRTRTEAVEKQRIAEMKLDETRANPKAKPSQIADREAALARAKNDVTDATDRLTVAEMRLQEIQSKGAPATTGTPVVKRLNGGTIPGTGRGDIIPMMGEPGEEVIRRSVAERNRGALQHLNATGRWPEFHQDGGTVGGFGGYKAPTLARVGVLDHGPGFWMEQAYRVASFGYGAAAMGASAINPDGTYGGLSTGAATMPILDDIAKKLDEVIKEGRVGSIGIYVGEGGQIVVDDMGDLRSTQDDAVQDAMMRSAVMR